MAVVVAWSSIYLQFSSFNFICSGLFGDILCLRFFLSWAYIWLLVNALMGFPNFSELFNKEVFVLHVDVIIWTTATLYVHASKFTGIVLNERKVSLPPESLPLYRMLYRNGGLSELLFKQFVWPRFEMVHLKKGDRIEDNSSLYIVLDGMASAKVKIKDQVNDITLASGEVVHIKFLHLFRQADCEAFANQAVDAVALTDMTLYKCTPHDIKAIARQPQTKQAYQGLLIFVLTRIAERAILKQERQFTNERSAAFLPLEDWEQPDPLISGSGYALTVPFRHMAASLYKSYRPPWPIIRWMPGLRHAALPAPHHSPPPDSMRSSKVPYGTFGESSSTTEEESSDAVDTENKSLV